MPAQRIKEQKPAELRLGPEDRALLERFASAVQVLRDVDPIDMTAPRIEVLLGVILRPERSLIEHGLALGMSTLNAYRHGSAWCDINVKGKEGYGHMLSADRPFFEGGERGADRRADRRKYVALNGKGAKLVEQLLLALKG
jgi:hypothetical protein